MSLIQTLGIPLYDDVGISYDLLRFPTALIMKQSVREILSPYTLFARNHITNQDECVVRMSQLHLNPWLSVYSNPDNSIVLDENYPLLPVDLVEQWNTPKIDDTIINLSRTPGQYVPTPTVDTSNKLPLIDQVQPIDASKINIPDNNLAILNFTESPDQLRLTRNEPEKVENFCMRNVKLSVQLNTVDNFRDNVQQANETEDTNELLRRLERGESDPKRRKQSSMIDENIVSSRPSQRDDFLNLLRY